MIKTNEHTVDRRDLFGRTILTAERPPGPLTKESVGKIMNSVIDAFWDNADAVSYLHSFYRGCQPVLGRSKTIRPEIKNIIIENRAFEIVEFKKGYEFSHPVQYTNAGMNEPSHIDVLNTYARLDGKDKKDLELAEWMYICGVSYRLCLPNSGYDRDSAPYYTTVLDPRNAFVVYSNTVDRRPLLSGTVLYSEPNSLKGIAAEWKFGVYTENRYYLFTLSSRTEDFTQAKCEEMANPLGTHPIVEYFLNDSRMGYVELCLSLFNAINTVDSNRIDSIEQLVQSILVFLNCEPPPDDGSGGSGVKSGDALVVKSAVSGMNADVKFITSILDQNQTQTTKEDLLDAIYEICGVPDRKTRGNGGGDTGQAVVLRDGWGAAEARAKSTEKLFRASEYEYLRIVLRICRDMAADEIGGLSLRDIDVRFTRNRSDNMLVKAQTLEILLRNGINAEDSIEVSDLFSDPSAVLLKSEKQMDALLLKLAQKRESPALPNAPAPPNNPAPLNGQPLTGE